MKKRLPFLFILHPSFSSFDSMGLIKSDSAPPSLTPFSFQDVEDQARALLLEAGESAERLLAAARTEADEMRARAQARGFDEGRSEGVNQGIQEGIRAGREQALAEHGAALKASVETLGAAMARIEASRQALEIDALQDVIELAIAIARRVTKRQGELDPRVMIENLREAMGLVVHSSDVRVVIHPAQLQALQEALPLLAVDLPQFSHVTIIEDDSLSPGGCRIITRGGRIDADLDAQLDRVVSDLLPSTQEAVAAV